MLSLPVTAIKPHYDVIVVGSGYGGGIAASRMARGGKSVCLLERGREIQPGHFPDNPVKAAEEMQSESPAGHVGSPTGLFHFHLNGDISVLTGCGLGGTSLINANVSLRAEPRVFEDPRWPSEFRQDLAGRLQDGYRRAEDMLQPLPYPDDFPILGKIQAQQNSAESLQARFYRTPVNVTFQEGTNYAGIHQNACTLCGDCVSGCNYGAKNTTLMNYLPDAVHHGASIFTSVRVDHIEQRDGRLVVHYEPVGVGRSQFDAPLLFVTADIVILGAGTLGSTEILLRSKLAGLPMSNRLGEHFTGNGDFLAYAYNNSPRINGIGFGHHSTGDLDPVGPCISSVVDLREQPELTDGMVVEEGVIPGALASLMPAMFAAVAGTTGVQTGSPSHVIEQRIREADSLLRGPYHGAVNHSQTYLVMAHDDGAGKMSLLDGRLKIDWPGVGDQPIFGKIRRTLIDVTRANKGVYVDNPLYHPLMKDRLITVHPLGGAVMAERAEDGVVDHRGRVFSSPSGTDTIPGLYVCDGSVIPVPLGVNPLLTISAVAERACALIAEERGFTIDYSKSVASFAPPVDGEETIGIEFTETMAGFVSNRPSDDYGDSYQQGKDAGDSLEFTLTIAAADMYRMISDPATGADMSGTVRCPSLSKEALTVSNGRFFLFTKDPAQPRNRQMIYHMTLTGENGHVYWFEGFKEMVQRQFLAVWGQTTTLYVKVHDGVDATAPVIRTGILRIRPQDFMKQLTTLKVINAPNTAAALKAKADFGAFFSGSLMQVYGAHA